MKEQYHKFVRSYNISSSATPAEQRQRDLFDRWAAAHGIVDAATTPGEAEGSAAPVPA